MDTTNAIILLAAIAEVLLLIICIIGYRVAFLKRQLTDLRIKMVISQREEQMRHQILIDQIKQQKNVNALDNLQNLFADKNKEIKRIYPALTETDMQVVTLIGLGVDNSDILQLTDMSKRTYYKRNSIDWFPIVSWIVLASLVFLVLIPFKNGYPAVTHNIVALCVYVVAMLPFFLAPRRNRYLLNIVFCPALLLPLSVKIQKNHIILFKNLPVSAKISTFAADFEINLADNGIYIRHTVCREVRH